MTSPVAASGRRGAARGGVRRYLVLLAVVALAVLVGAAVYRTHGYVSHEAAFCGGSCHIPKDATDSWHSRGHEGVQCQSCHPVNTGSSYGLLWRKVLATRDVPKHGKAEARECTSCHQKKPAEWRLISATEGHRTHRAVKDVDCIACHGPATHKAPAPAEQLCLKCHEMARLHKQANDAETCLSCHSFAVSSRLAQKLTTRACEGCHADPAKILEAAKPGAKLPAKLVGPEVLHGGLDCKLCHDPHGRKPRVPEGQPVCARCHQFEMFQAGTEERKGPEGHRNCEGCHRPHMERKHALDSCVRCHETRAKGITAAGAGTSSATKHRSCASCHLPHSWRAERAGCMTCHEDKAASILNASPAGHNECTKCHDVHGPPPSGQVCLKCHSDTKSKHVALAPARHKDCTACHNPHAASRVVARGACAGCHTQQLANVMRDGPQGHAKGGCFGCHKPHENPLPPADLCSQCHGEKAKVVAAAGPPKHRVCTSCHQPHKFAITSAAAACSKCHGPIIQPGGPHQGDCKKCHTLHGTPTVPKSACFECHQNVSAVFKPPPGNEQHSKCRSCHQPHRPASTAPAKCPTCHQPKAEVAKAWPPSSAHAQECNKCHQPHDVRSKKPCVECHASEAASAMGGKHQCMQCHPPHKAPPGAGPAWWGRCQSCHAEKAQSVKSRGPKHSECKNCHQPHRFAVPACTTCHKAMQDKGAHGIKEHAAKCNACHNPHTSDAPVRAQCLACHTNKQSHQPEAQRCQACHPFL